MVVHARAAGPLVVAALVALVCSACRADLGECDVLAAQEVVFLDTENVASAGNGLPMYAGQALMHVSCGYAQFCHSEGASKGERYGVPLGLDFEMAFACDEGPCETDAEGISRLHRNQRNVLAYARQILSTVRSGSMPPGRIGREIVASAGHFRRVDIARAETFDLREQELRCDHELADCAMGETTTTIPTPRVPDLGTPEGNEILRNWLACGAPVVESTVDGTPPGASCSAGSGVGHAGECVVRISQPPEPPDQNWTAIYETVIEPFCGRACHGPGIPTFIRESQLDLSDQDLAYQSMFGIEAAGEECGGFGLLIDPGNADGSLFLSKMQRNPECGDPMPSMGSVLPPEVLDVIRAWIDEGAPDN